MPCAECGVRYDPAVNAFCPRCGSTARGTPEPAVLAVARRRDPARRRVQASGAVLLSVGSLLTLLFIPVLLFSGSLMDATVEQLMSDPEMRVPGGRVIVVATDNGTPLAGAPVQLIAAGTAEVLANGTTNETGRFTGFVGKNAFVNISLEAPPGTFLRRAVAIDGATTTVRIDVGRDEIHRTSWTGVQPLLLMMRILVAVFLAIALLLAAAGLCALRLRAWGFAVAGAALGAVPLLILTVATLSVGFMLMLFVVAAPLVIIARGRRYFEAGEG